MEFERKTLKCKKSEFVELKHKNESIEKNLKKQKNLKIREQIKKS